VAARRSQELPLINAMPPDPGEASGKSQMPLEGASDLFPEPRKSKRQRGSNRQGRRSWFQQIGRLQMELGVGLKKSPQGCCIP